jgi:SAM-dependent methyltransferase
MQEVPPIAPITKADIEDELWLEITRYHATAMPIMQGMHALSDRSPAQALAGVNTRLPLVALLELDGLAFVDAAYRTILARAPDDAGVAYFMREMAAGRSKVMLLGQLQRSAEGRSAGRVVPGLRRRYVMQRAYRVPVLGGVARIAGDVMRRAGVSRRIAGPNDPGAALRRTPRAVMLGMLGIAQESLERRADEQQATIEAVAWRVEALQAAQERAARAAEDQHAADAARNRLSAEVQAARSAEQGRAIAELVAQSMALAEQNATLAEQCAAFVGQSEAHARRIGAVEDSSIDALLSMSDTLAAQAERLLRIERMLDGEAIVARIDEGASALGGKLDERLRRVETAATQNSRDVADQQRRVGLMLEALRARRDGVVGDEVAALDAQDDHVTDALYVDFENRFRGTRATIKERQRFYLPILGEMRAGTPDRPILDVGCGRGEFLELLHDEGLVGSGVDSNVAMVEACRTLGLDCAADDALAYLARLAPDSLGAVTGFHIIEHLPFKTMVRLFDETLRALAPGGVMIFETPNPANLMVASRWFYLDPTHRNPLPGEMVSMIAEARGFNRVSIVELHPTEQHFGGNDTVLREQLDRLFHGPQDYALLARKP